MTPIKVKITVGEVTVEIETTPETLDEAVEKVLNVLKASQAAKPTIERQGHRSITCRAVVEEIVKEGWMDSGRSLSEVAAEVARRGYSYDRTAVAHVLLEMVREGILERRGEARRYLYIRSSRRELEPVSGPRVGLDQVGKTETGDDIATSI
ncbi:hypothetical protein HRbin01_00369 [archaeon HR01]|nr:hypothetical protein HRbin01_00369 [archaeon HR01]